VRQRLLEAWAEATQHLGDCRARCLLKYVARRRLLGEKRGSFALKGSNWFARPVDLSEKAWKADLALLDQEHAKLREAVAGLKPASLSFIPSTSKVSNLALICGVANHDVYYAG
jgi:hypothetical protein